MAAQGEVEARGRLQRADGRGADHERSDRTGREAPADTCIAPTYPRAGSWRGRRQAPGTEPIARDGKRERGGIVDVTALAPARGLRWPAAWLRPHFHKTRPTRLWPHGTTRPARVGRTARAMSTATADVRRASCNRPERASASASRCEIMSSGKALPPGQRRPPVCSAIPVQEGDEVQNQERSSNSSLRSAARPMVISASARRFRSELAERFGGVWGRPVGIHERWPCRLRRSTAHTCQC